MAACVVAFSGFDTFGRAVEVAQSVSGAWYSREYSFNGYAMAWSKWSVLDTVTYATNTVNQYDGTVSELPAGQFINWGFNTLQKFDTTPRFRLPV